MTGIPATTSPAAGERLHYPTSGSKCKHHMQIWVSICCQDLHAKATGGIWQGNQMPYSVEALGIDEDCCWVARQVRMRHGKSNISYPRSAMEGNVQQHSTKDFLLQPGHRQDSWQPMVNQPCCMDVQQRWACALLLRTPSMSASGRPLIGTMSTTLPTLLTPGTTPLFWLNFYGVSMRMFEWIYVAWQMHTQLSGKHICPSKTFSAYCRPYGVPGEKLNGLLKERVLSF